MNKEHLSFIVIAASASALAGSALAQSVALVDAGPNKASVVTNSPAALAAVDAVAKVCLPILKGQPAAKLASSAGFSASGGAWTMTISGKRQVLLDPPDKLNPHLCSITITHEATNAAAIRAAVSGWAASQSPALSLVNNQSDASAGLATATWTAQTGTESEGVVLAQPIQSSSSPPAHALEQSTLYVSLSPS